MSIRKSVVSVCVTIGLALSVSQAIADFRTGQVTFNVLVSLPDSESVVVANVVDENGVGQFCFAVSNEAVNSTVSAANSATIAGFATILAANKITGSDVTINCSDTNELTSVQ